MLGRIHDHVDFPSTRIKERVYGGFCARSPVRRSTLDTISRMEGQFARGVYAQSAGEEIDLTFIEVELKAIYVSSGLVDALDAMTGRTHSAESLLARIRQQIVSMFIADA